jgi:hypothetical protein
VRMPCFYAARTAATHATEQAMHKERSAWPFTRPSNPFTVMMQPHCAFDKTLKSHLHNVPRQLSLETSMDFQVSTMI